MARKVTGTLYKRDKIYWCKFKYQGKEYRFSLQTGKKNHATHELDRLMTIRRVAMQDGSFYDKFGSNTCHIPIPHGKVPVGSAWQLYLQNVNRPDAGDTTLHQYKFQFNYFTKWLIKAHPEIECLTYVNRIIAEEFAAHIRTQFSAGTYNKYISLFNLMFRILMDHSSSYNNPWQRIARLRNNPNTRRVFSDNELTTIFEQADGEIFNICMIAYHTAFRFGDACQLEWKEVDLDKRLIARTPLKTKRRTGKQVIIPMHQELLKHLMAIKQSVKSKFVSPEMAKMYDKCPASANQRLQRFFKKCGFQLYEDGTGRGTGKRAVVEVGFHSFRHTWVTKAAERGMDSASIRSVAGWGNPTMEKLYTHISTEHLEKSMNGHNPVNQSHSTIDSLNYENMSPIELQRLISEAQKELNLRVI